MKDTDISRRGMGWALVSILFLNSLTTLIQTLGLISVGWLVGQVILGGGSVWYGGAAFGGGMKAKMLWKYHR